MTEFCHVDVPIDLPGGRVMLSIDGNGKITCGGGDFAHPEPNAFSLPHVETCPGATPSCLASCYVFGLKRDAPRIAATYANNLVALRTMLERDPQMLGAIQLGDWIARHCRHFRWHVSGDVFSPEHARWIATVALNSPLTRHWIYTRSHQWAYLLHTANMTVNLSADRDNYDSSIRTNRKWGFRVCYMATVGHSFAPLAQRCATCGLSRHSEGLPCLPPLPPGSVIFPDYALRGRDLTKPTDAPWWGMLTSEERKMVCPPDFFGQDRSRRCGVCVKCIKPCP